jgi:hypothetical protein
MLGRVSALGEPACQGRRKLSIDQETHLSGHAEDWVVSLPRGELQGGGDIGRFEIWVVLEDLFAGGTRREKVEDVFDTDAQPADAGAPTTLIGTHGDARQLAHGRCSCSW